MVPDEELFEAWGSGDSVAGGQLVDRHLVALQRFFGSKVTGEADVEDLVGDALENCLKARDSFRREASFKTFLLRIAHFTLCRYLRTKGRTPETHDIESQPVADLGPGPATLMAAKAERRMLVEALRSLPLMYQVVLELKHFEGLSRTEIADVLSLPAGTVATRLRVGRARLDRVLEELAGSASLLRSTQTELERWADDVRRGRA